ncbi:zygotic gap protein knirps-like [Pollicipes pollicipes]|uniref:zygotic gap protein knirps-like n=1 Tax=Pollicipes pollicipes TaxID=41117 RepID=UPI001884C001|nr:zygotic gap protein knirps-like [Pollicipes pollicipes]
MPPTEGLARPSSGVSTLDQPCAVCNVPAAGYHFGAFTCEGCKSFYGRTYKRTERVEPCRFNNQCDITGRNRTSCKSCRMLKCKMVGMSRAHSRYGRRSNWFTMNVANASAPATPAVRQQVDQLLDQERRDVQRHAERFRQLQQLRRETAAATQNGELLFPEETPNPGKPRLPSDSLDEQPLDEGTRYPQVAPVRDLNQPVVLKFIQKMYPAPDDMAGVLDLSVGGRDAHAFSEDEQEQPLDLCMRG